MTGRHLLHIPEIAPHTFLFFYAKGDSGLSWSLRDYPPGGGVRVLYAKQFSWTAAEILAMARHREDAPSHPVEDIGFWRERITALNRQYLGSDGPAPAPPGVRETPAPPPIGRPGTPYVPPAGSLTVFHRTQLLSHPVKGAKAQDLHRIFTSPNSEDRLTWNVSRILDLLGPEVWWPVFLDLARRDNPALDVTDLETELPVLALWRNVASPAGYEAASRERMARSEDVGAVDRSRKREPVEGESEIDLVLESPKFLIYVEAKRGSDISARTTWDPERNQIERNIDCVLAESGSRRALFWMLVSDRGPGRAYTQTIDEFRRDPSRLVERLAHHDSERVRGVARDTALILWGDLMREVGGIVKQVERDFATRIF